MKKDQCAFDTRSTDDAEGASKPDRPLVPLHGNLRIWYGVPRREGGRVMNPSHGPFAVHRLELQPDSGCGEVSAEAESARLTDIVFDPTDMDGMVARLEELRTRHRELDRTIEQLEAEGGHDIQVMGLKREKLRIKDRISWLSAKITPDIIA
jgi:hypothetical protein